MTTNDISRGSPSIIGTPLRSQTQGLPHSLANLPHRPSDSRSSLKPTPARFIHHAGRRNTISSTSLSTTPLTTSHDIHGPTLDITEAAVVPNSNIDAQNTLHVGYPPSLGPFSPKLARYSPRGQSIEHTPVAATAVFARGAPPLYLPKLDRHLESIPSPNFSKATTDDNGMFSPMGELSELKSSLDDLETNARRPPVWRNRTTILGSTVNLVIGFMVSHLLFFTEDANVRNRAQVHLHHFTVSRAFSTLFRFLL
jgi:hypothetical protein